MTRRSSSATCRVPFTWTFRLFPAWLATTALVLAVYYFWDRWADKRETREDRRRDRLEVRPIRIAGKENLVLLGGIVVAAAFLGTPWREAAMVLLAFASFKLQTFHLKYNSGKYVLTKLEKAP